MLQKTKRKILFCLCALVESLTSPISRAHHSWMTPYHRLFACDKPSCFAPYKTRESPFFPKGLRSAPEEQLILGSTFNIRYENPRRVASALHRPGLLWLWWPEYLSFRYSDQRHSLESDRGLNYYYSPRVTYSHGHYDHGLGSLDGRLEDLRIRLCNMGLALAHQAQEDIMPACCDRSLRTSDSLPERETVAHCNVDQNGWRRTLCHHDIVAWCPWIRGSMDRPILRDTRGNYTTEISNFDGCKPLGRCCACESQEASGLNALIIYRTHRSYSSKTLIILGPQDDLKCATDGFSAIRSSRIEEWREDGGIIRLGMFVMAGKKPGLAWGLLELELALAFPSWSPSRTAFDQIHSLLLLFSG